MKTKRIIGALSICILLLSSCDKSEDNLNFASSESDLSNRVYFSNVTTYKETIKELNGLDQEGLRKWQSENNVNLPGLESEVEYQATNFELFNTQSELLEFVDSNSLLDIESIDEKTFVVPLLYSNPNRLIANEEGLFQVGEKVFKVLDEITVGTTSSNISGLSQINIDNYKSFLDDTSYEFDMDSNTPAMRSAHIHSSAKYSDEEEDTKKPNRLKFSYSLKREIYTPGYYGQTTPGYTHYALYYFARPYKRTLGIYYFCKRTVTLKVRLRLAIEVGNILSRYYINESVSIVSGSGNWKYFDVSYSESELTYALDDFLPIFGLSDSDQTLYDYELKAYDLSAHTSSYGTVSFEYNTSLINHIPTP